VSTDITTLLTEGRVTFSYRKTDGTTRKATGTTRNDLIPEDKRAETTQDANSQTVAYYDEGKSAWRSFRRENLDAATVEAEAVAV
jgi:hypothetical protein